MKQNWFVDCDCSLQNLKYTPFQKQNYTNQIRILTAIFSAETKDNKYEEHFSIKSVEFTG